MATQKKRVRKGKTNPIADLPEQTSVSADSLLKPKEATTFGNPKYLGCSRGPRNPRKKSEITLYAAKKIGSQGASPSKRGQ